MRKNLSLFLFVLFLMGMSMQVYAKDISTYSSGSLVDCSIGVSITSRGIGVSYTTAATSSAVEIGCKNIVLQEKVNGKWIDINIPSGKTSNSSSYSGSSVYTAAVKGRAYRAHCTHYANFNGTVKTLYNECDSIVFN